ncbi:hypothetical protein K490DRAFT_38133 [Saccharata proteae CBS 121410]|uniref:Trafficking protein particle complex subunit 11 domain-containing protein n=1 Tax=Saccharata proteae CBS 121410 TaxID=1314787 RepID=A0A6A5YCI5_9PEZI|nr:hypothetical protein K490DRAFT_38133 [Saccharata proteae CBS 121410]
MDAYPPDYVEHNLPLLVLSGLATETPPAPIAKSHTLIQEHGFTVESEVPAVTGDRAEQLRQEFLNADASNSPWNARRSKTRGDVIGFKIRAVGRDYAFTPRKAQPPQSSPDDSPRGSPMRRNSRGWILHSPISPLSPGSPTFPDGVMTPIWVAKHQLYVPSVFISFFEFASNPGQDTLHDNQLKSEINRIKGMLNNSEHRTRYAVVLLGDKTIMEAPELEERLTNIRRSTNLDPKSSYFFLPPTQSRVELASFVHSVLATLQPVCVDYYRELSKHSRRKKNRGNIPPPTAPPTTGTSHPLAGNGWSVRYDFKLGVFAEFRQEMDAACRHYSSAMDCLLDPDGIFETTASWSPRWDDTRLLADSIAIRIVRCLLWTNSPTSAVQSWQNYRDRVRDLLDRRGKGSANYSWRAWESRWAKIMAEIVQRVEPPIFAIVGKASDADVEPNALFSPPEKIFPAGERMPPWQMLHHPGYWYRLAAERAIARRVIAEEIPEEDRTSPSESSATQVATRYRTYDTYLVPEPHVEYPLQGREGFDHCSEITDLLNKATGEFHSRGQQHFVDKLALDMGRELIHAGRYNDALSVLRPLWEGMSWRKENWWSLVSEVTWALHECGQRCADEPTILETEWELMSQSIWTKQNKRHDFMRCLEHVAAREGRGKTKVVVQAQKRTSCLSISTTFAVSEGHVGEPIQTQIAIKSNARKGSSPVTLSCVSIQLKNCPNDFQIRHEQTGSGSPSGLIVVSLTEAERASADAKPALEGTADLTLHPGHVKVLTFPVIFREAGDINGVTTSFEIDTDRFNMQSVSVVEKLREPSFWWLPSRKVLRTKRLSREVDDPLIKVLPKPPKMEIRMPNLQPQYYTNERVTLDLEVTNGEEEETEATIELRLLGHSRKSLDFTWEATKDPAPHSDVLPEDLHGHIIGTLKPGAQTTHSISFAAPDAQSEYTMEVKVLYHLLSDRDVPVSKTLSGELVFVDPFDATYDFTPQIHPDPWPSYFHVDDDQTVDSTKPFGLISRYLMSVRISSFAEENLIIQDADLIINNVQKGAVCTILKPTTKAADPPGETDIAPQSTQIRNFLVDVQKLHLENREPSVLDTSVTVTWRRQTPITTSPSPSSSDPLHSITSTIIQPRLIAANTEPRVLASAVPSTTTTTGNLPTPLIHLSYYIENPTMHPLTFEVAMEASDEFAFAGSKIASTLQLLPVSRKVLRYALLPLVRGQWISPVLKVEDRYFKKILKVVPTEGLRADKKGVAVWADVEEEDGREGEGTGAE